MAAPRLKSSLARAIGDLDEVSALTSFIGTTSKVVAASGAIANLVQADGGVRPIIEDFRKKKIDDLNVIYQGLYIQTFSSYEAFVRRLIAEFVEKVGRTDKTFVDLDKRSGFINRHTYHTGVALQQVFENRTNVALDFAELAKNLASVSADSQAIVLNSVAFTLQLSSLNADGLEKALRRVGINSPTIWDDLAKADAFHTLYNSKKTREVSKRIRETLDEIVKRRNHIVHRGEAIQGISEADVQEAVYFFKALDLGLATLASNSV